MRTLTEITPEDIDLLNRYFSTKTMFDVKLGCAEEAKQVLQASLTDLPVRNAVSSLRALREDFETSRDGSTLAGEQNSSYTYGLQQYCTALGGLASNLSALGSKGLKSALLCCQIFISIEQVRGNYTAMAQHIIRGLRIMRECQARPCLIAPDELIPAQHDQLPLLDAFIIKLFTAPCKFTDPAGAPNMSGTTLPVCLISSSQQAVESGDHRKVAPDMRTELKRIAASTLVFLDNVSNVKSPGNALLLLSEKTALLDTLRIWLVEFESSQSSGAESVSTCFMRLFYLTLKVVLLGVLDSSQYLQVELQMEIDRLQSLANSVGERLEVY